MRHTPRTALLLPFLALLAAGCQHTRSTARPPAADDELRATATASATAEDLDDRKAVRAEELLQGRFAGVQVFNTPGGGISVRIRGTNSFYGSNEPLFVLDGVPLTPGPGGALHGINPGDIAKIEVLKDAGATAIYGVRGANGVILITTKR